jgi:hypothetical protein
VSELDNESEESDQDDDSPAFKRPLAMSSPIKSRKTTNHATTSRSTSPGNSAQVNVIASAASTASSSPPIDIIADLTQSAGSVRRRLVNDMVADQELQHDVSSLEKLYKMIAGKLQCYSAACRLHAVILQKYYG